jgi:hypothetical protein
LGEVYHATSVPFLCHCMNHSYLGLGFLDAILLKIHICEVPYFTYICMIFHWQQIWIGDIFIMFNIHQTDHWCMWQHSYLGHSFQRSFHKTCGCASFKICNYSTGHLKILRISKFTLDMNKVLLICHTLTKVTTQSHKDRRLVHTAD